MVTVPASPFVMGVFGVFFGGLGLYMLVSALPLYLEKQDGGLLFLLIMGVVFCAIGAVAFWRLVKARRNGYGWFSPISRQDF